MAEELCIGWFRIVAGSLEIEECKSAIMMEGLKKRTRKAFGIRKKEKGDKDNDSTGSPDRDGGSQKRANGAAVNGFSDEIDWDRYNTPTVDDEGYSLRPDEEEVPGSPGPKPPKEHFFSSSESEGEEDLHKKFKIKIKPLPAESANCLAPSVDELKASIGNIALFPSPLRSSPRRSPGLMNKDCSEEIQVARPRRSAPIAAPTLAAPALQAPRSKKSPAAPVAAPVPEDATALFGPPLETAFREQKTEVGISERVACDVWGAPLPESESLSPDFSFTRTFPKGTPPPLPPKNVPTSPPPTSSPSAAAGASSPVRPATPSAPSAVFSSPTPPPPPPRPSSRPKLPPGKPSKGDMSRPFSPPVSHSSSPPSIATLARAESTSSISSNNSLSAATTPTVENDQPSLVWFDRGKFYLTFEGCSRGPSPLTMGTQDTLPVAAAFTETVNAFFKGANPNKCVVKITGEMVLSFPAGITRHFANNPSPAVLTFSITHYSWLEHVLPNPQLLCCDTATTPNPDCKTFWVNMPNLMTHLKKVAEQKPQATYYNVDMLKYQVSAQGLTSTPLNLAASWRCEPTSTDLRIDYKYNGGAMTTPVALNNVQFLIPVDGGVTKLQAVLPPAAWNAEQQRILWKIPDISQKSENGGIGSLLARFQLSEGPSKPSPLAVQFTSEGSTLSGCDIELAGPGYRFSLIKKRFAAGKYLADN
ncbi:SH3-containing GRB2-like protein 3-interacting protein 1 [Coregonus clupeaformis]|uniref:SH3-containing GRB2-like protein 3-interacting protein 1 n=1 Tax=Coregonus clupeaformis TaxID=59861 RepID=UPI001E1C4A8D|nr:SH3-containing GRB2-like protein 3-interacting protein 1 [Coregonus clupeaformis]